MGANLLRMLAGAVFFGLLLLVVLHFQRDEVRDVASKALRVDGVSRMQVALIAAAEAEKSAVLSPSDQEAQRFAAESRAASAEVEHERAELDTLLARGGTSHERDLLAQFSEVFAQLRHTDDDILELAGKNTNVKAFGLLFGDARDLLTELEGALGQVVAAHAESAQVTALADGARIGALHLQILLAPHIAEESEAKEDQLEALMLAEETQVRKDLDELQNLSALQGNAELRAAAAAFDRYHALKVRILVLSRENSNVKSLALSLNAKRKMMGACADALEALRQAILDEANGGVFRGKPPQPPR